MKLPQLNTQEMLELENLAMKEFGVSVDQMMQQAGQSIHDFVVGELPEAKRILVVAGKGNNGGDALIAGSRLMESGKSVEFFLVGKHETPDFSGFDLIIDGIFGFSLKGDPRSPEKEIIQQVNHSKIPILAVDVPSGLEVFTGEIKSPAVQATHTLALGMPKKGLKGKCHLGDLGIPRDAYKEKGYEAPDFSSKNYLPLD